MDKPESVRFVIYQEAPRVWVGRGLEHDLTVEARSIGEAVRSLTRLVEAQSAFDMRHHRAPLSAFTSAPQRYWNAFNTGTPVSLAEFAVASPSPWDISVAIAHHRPSPADLPRPARARFVESRS